MPSLFVIDTRDIESKELTAMKSIVWLASYPKSGNTWLRAFLANYVRNSDEPVPINKFHHLGIGDSNANAYRMVSKEPFDGNNPVQCAKLRNAVLRGIVNNKADVNFVKTHNENGFAFGVKLIPPEVTRSAIYIMRNPLDMILSYASHYALSVDEAIFAAGSKEHSIPGGVENAYQFLGNWSNHVVGWTKARKFKVLTLRYEDMLADPHDAFARVIHNIGLPDEPDRLERAVRFSDFKLLSAQENKAKFIENSENQKRFFRKGTSGQWKAELTSDQIDEITKAHGSVMKKYGYL